MITKLVFYVSETWSAIFLENQENIQHIN